MVCIKDTYPHAQISESAAQPQRRGTTHQVLLSSSKGKSYLPKQKAGLSSSRGSESKRECVQVKAEGMQQAWQEGERLPHQQWVGEKTSFMRSNEHSRERRGVWDTQGLQAAALTLVEGDRDNGRSQHVLILCFMHCLLCTSDAAAGTAAGQAQSCSPLPVVAAACSPQRVNAYDQCLHPSYHMCHACDC